MGYLQECLLDPLAISPHLPPRSQIADIASLSSKVSYSIPCLRVPRFSEFLLMRVGEDPLSLEAPSPVSIFLSTSLPPSFR